MGMYAWNPRVWEVDDQSEAHLCYVDYKESIKLNLKRRSAVFDSQHCSQRYHYCSNTGQEYSTEDGGWAEDYKFKASMSYTERLYPQMKFANLCNVAQRGRGTPQNVLLGRIQIIIPKWSHAK